MASIEQSVSEEERELLCTPLQPLPLPLPLPSRREKGLRQLRAVQEEESTLLRTEQGQCWSHRLNTARASLVPRLPPHTGSTQPELYSLVPRLPPHTGNECRGKAGGREGIHFRCEGGGAWGPGSAESQDSLLDRDMLTYCQTRSFHHWNFSDLIFDKILLTNILCFQTRRLGIKYIRDIIFAKISKQAARENI